MSTQYQTHMNPSTINQRPKNLSPIVSNQRSAIESESQLRRESRTGMIGAKSFAVMPSINSSTAYHQTDKNNSSSRKRKRYNPNEDPNFLASQKAAEDQRLLMLRAEQEADLSMEFVLDGEQDTPVTEGDVSQTQSDDEQRAVISGIKKKAPINAREKAKVRTAACVLMKKEKQGRVSQIGGGKAFR